MRRLDGDGFRLFVYSFTNGTCASLTGFTEASSRKLRRAVWPHDPDGVSEDVLDATLAALAAKPLVLYDWDAELLLCVERVRYAVQNPNQAKAVCKWIERLPPSKLVDSWSERFRQPFRERFGQPLPEPRS